VYLQDVRRSTLGVIAEARCLSANLLARVHTDMGFGTTVDILNRRAEPPISILS
jgi:hypothetical protein